MAEPHAIGETQGILASTTATLDEQSPSWTANKFSHYYWRRIARLEIPGCRSATAGVHWAARQEANVMAWKVSSTSNGSSLDRVPMVASGYYQQPSFSSWVVERLLLRHSKAWLEGSAKEAAELAEISSQLGEVASLFLYRFSPELLQQRMQALARYCCKRRKRPRSLKSSTDARTAETKWTTKFLSMLFRELNECRAVYFGRKWNSVEVLIQPNQTDRAALESKVHAGELRISCASDAGMDEVETVEELASAVAQCGLLLAFFSVPLVANCQSMREVLHEVQRFLNCHGSEDVVLNTSIVEVNCSLAQELRDECGVYRYPTIQFFRQDGTADLSKGIPYPRKAARTSATIVEFMLCLFHNHSPIWKLGRASEAPILSVERLTLSDSGVCLDIIPCNDCQANDITTNIESGLAATDAWSAFSEGFKVAALEERLHEQRVFVMSEAIQKMLNCCQLECNMTPLREGGSLPTIIFLGGGMGAGKSTVVEHSLKQLPFFAEIADTTVIIEADKFKARDPLYEALLNQGDSDAAEKVHQFSQRAAEEAFLEAIRLRRDIIFDGTLSWLPFVEQTLAMISDVDHVYEKGPGYLVRDDGAVEEEYWTRLDGKCEPRCRSRLVLVGVTTKPELAVVRGIVRKIVTGRSVPVPGQLKSFQMFSTNYCRYVDMFDSVYLFDTTFEIPTVIASKTDGCHQVHYQRAFDDFIAQANINTDADSAGELAAECCTAEEEPPPVKLLNSLLGNLQS